MCCKIVCHHIHLLDFTAITVITVELERILFITIMLDLAEFRGGGGGGGGGARDYKKGGECLHKYWTLYVTRFVKKIRLIAVECNRILAVLVG